MDAQAVLRPAPRRGPRVPARLLRLAADERLVELVRAGSEPAFEAIFDRHHRGVLAFSRHMLGSAEEAEDAVQHTFLAAYRVLRADDGRAIHLRPWLYAIARNRCLSVLRARRERPLADVAEPSTEHLAEAVQRREDLRAMLRDVSELPDAQRAALVLAELGDVSHEEIAEVLGVRREKVKALVFQARSSLAASRVARESSCAEVREQLATLRGGALRRTPLRRHLRDCAGCREFRAEMGTQRRALALLLPVVPTAGLKGAVLGSAFGGSAAAAGGAAGGASGSVAAGASGATATVTGAASSVGGAGLAAKALLVVAVAGSGAAVGGHELSSRSAAPGAGQARAVSAGPRHAHGAGAAVPAAGASRAQPAKVAGLAPAVAHGHGYRARGHRAAGNHGRGGGTGGGRTRAPGRLAKGGAGTAAHSHRTTAPGRLHARGTGASPIHASGSSHGAAAGRAARPSSGTGVRTARSNTPRRASQPSSGSAGGGGASHGRSGLLRTAAGAAQRSAATVKGPAVRAPTTPVKAATGRRGG